MHQMVLLQAEVQDLREANQALSKRRKAKKRRVRQGGSLTLQEGQDLLAQKDVAKQGQKEENKSCIVVGGGSYEATALWTIR
ncbi:hypothetical protein F5Y02DRAFT_401636 [Annulohypoxylon stygium]|nr:hypothetical protein F5Y02DRAFT_401636 [Annulohypoxylon stygium]